MVFFLLVTIFFELPITRTPDNSNFFLEGSSYWESTLYWLYGYISVSAVWEYV